MPFAISKNDGDRQFPIFSADLEHACIRVLGDDGVLGLVGLYKTGTRVLVLNIIAGRDEIFAVFAEDSDQFVLIVGLDGSHQGFYGVAWSGKRLLIGGEADDGGDGYEECTSDNNFSCFHGPLPLLWSGGWFSSRLASAAVLRCTHTLPTAIACRLVRTRVACAAERATGLGLLLRPTGGLRSRPAGLIIRCRAA